MVSFSGHGLACIRGQTLVFENLSFAVAPGQVVALTGANGSGKTSLLRVMAGLLEPSAGTLGERPPLHWIGADNALKPELTVKQNLAFFSGGENTIPALEKLGIARLADAPARALSAGQRRRAALARLFLADRPLWLLDEPATGLDDGSAKNLARLVRDHASGGGMAVIATHEPGMWGTNHIMRLGA